MFEVKAPDVKKNDIEIPVNNREIADGSSKIKPETNITMEKAKVMFENLFSGNDDIKIMSEDVPGSYEADDGVQTPVNDNRIDGNLQEPETDTENPVNRDANSTYKIDGIKYETDDNGNTYKKDNELLQNTEYEINGYKYSTDEQGRPISAEGTLHLKDADRAKKTINENNIGGEDKRDTDDRGHMIGDQFDGSNGLDNLIPMDANLNRGEYKALENKLAQSVKDGKNVEMKVEPIYEGDSKRPSEIAVTYTIDGEKTVQVFKNESADKRSDGGTEK